MSNNVWASPIGRDDRLSFFGEVQKAFPGADPAALNVEEVTFHYDVDFAVGDRASSAASPFEKKVLQAAAAAADASSILRRTQDPILDGTSRLPGDMVIGLFGVGVRYLASKTGVYDADPLNIAKELDACVLRVKQGALRRFEVVGDEFMSYGPGEQITTDTVAANALARMTKDRGWRRIKPTILGKDQQLEVSHFNGRVTDWPETFTLRFMFPGLLGRIK